MTVHLFCRILPHFSFSCRISATFFKPVPAQKNTTYILMQGFGGRPNGRDVLEQYYFSIKKDRLNSIAEA